MCILRYGPKLISGCQYPQPSHIPFKQLSESSHLVHSTQTGSSIHEYRTLQQPTSRFCALPHPWAFYLCPYIASHLRAPRSLSPDHYRIQEFPTFRLFTGRITTLALSRTLAAGSIYEPHSPSYSCASQLVFLQHTTVPSSIVIYPPTRGLLSPALCP